MPWNVINTNQNAAWQNIQTTSNVTITDWGMSFGLGPFCSAAFGSF